MGRPLSSKLKKVVRVQKVCLAHPDLIHQRMGSTIPFLSWSQIVVAGEEERSSGSGMEGQRLVFSLKKFVASLDEAWHSDKGKHGPEVQVMQGLQP